MTIEGVEPINTQVMAADIQTMRRIYPAVLQKNKEQVGAVCPRAGGAPPRILGEDE